MPSSILSIDGTNITLNLKDSSNLPALIEKVTVTLENLQEGNKVKAVLDLSILGKTEIERIVEADGKVSYESKEEFDAIQEILAYFQQSEDKVSITRKVKLQVENREDIEDTEYTVTVEF